MLKSNRWLSGTSVVLALGMTMTAVAPTIKVDPALAQYPRPSYQQLKIPAGTYIAVEYEKEKIVITPDESMSVSLKVKQDIRSVRGTVLIPRGSEIIGELKPAYGGSQFIAEQVIVNDAKKYSLDAISRVITETQRIDRGASAGEILRGAAIGGAAATALSGILGDKAIATEEILGGAGIGAIAGAILGRNKTEVIVIRPEEDLNLRLRSDLVVVRGY
ncbi:MAG: hypothetical protein SXA11_21515 [Cyanobacteriota bacterium]|nr:hypothetical protein [Cyanobacteriota bacterium]